MSEAALLVKNAKIFILLLYRIFIQLLNPVCLKFTPNWIKC